LKVNSPRTYLIIQTDNILINLSQNGELSNLVICDFGISKDLNVSIADTYAGTWAWMVNFLKNDVILKAPEVYRAHTSDGQKQYDAFLSDGIL
jgi:hypothetical protein